MAPVIMGRGGGGMQAQAPKVLERVWGHRSFIILHYNINSCEFTTLHIVIVIYHNFSWVKCMS